jgi:anthranilate synthase/aminodeoxychorismate synthase-like glutamine amidotransferase
MLLMIDNYDSFTYNIVHYVRNLGAQIEIVRNDADFDSIMFDRYAGVILSPGPSSPDNSGITLDVLRADLTQPVFGVCLGMQAMGLVFGAQVVHAKRLMHGKIDEVEHYGDRMFAGVPSRFKAVRYHSLAVAEDNLPSCLEVTARASDGEIMGLRHREKNIRGVQYHPESYLSEHGMTVIKNFLEECHEC